MNTSERILVIFLAAALTVFLTLGIIALFKIIQILNSIKQITYKAEQIADKAEAATEFFRATAGPAALGKLISNIFSAVKENKGKKRS